MKRILSRKGFDSQYGGQSKSNFAKWNFTFISNTTKEDILKFGELTYNNKTYDDLIKELNGQTRQINNDTKAHLDPDLKKMVICG